MDIIVLILAIIGLLAFGIYKAMESYTDFSPHHTWFDCSRYWASKGDNVLKRYINYMIRQSGVRTLEVDHKTAEQCKQHWRDVALTQSMTDQEMQLGME